MGNSIPSEISVSFDDSGGTLRNVTPYVLSINGINVEQILEEVHPFATSWEVQKAVGIGKVGAITIGGLYDDTATLGPDVLFAISTPDTPATATRTLTITLKTTGGTKSFSVECYRVSYARNPDRGAITKYEAVLQPTGAVTEV